MQEFIHICAAECRHRFQLNGSRDIQDDTVRESSMHSCICRDSFMYVPPSIPHRFQPHGIVKLHFYRCSTCFANLLLNLTFCFFLANPRLSHVGTQALTRTVMVPLFQVLVTAGNSLSHWHNPEFLGWPAFSGPSSLCEYGVLASKEHGARLLPPPPPHLSSCAMSAGGVVTIRGPCFGLVRKIR